MPKLTEEQVASIPGLLRELGSYRQVAAKLGVTKEAIRRRVVTPELQKHRSQVATLAAAPPPSDANGDIPRSRAKGLLSVLATRALKTDDPQLLYRAAQGFINLANSYDNAQKIAVTLVDARQVHQTTVMGAGQSPAWLVELFGRIEERLPGAMRVLREVLGEAGGNRAPVHEESGGEVLEAQLVEDLESDKQNEGA